MNKKIKLNGIKNIKREYLTDEIFSYFKNAIVNGNLPPGNPLPTEAELCAHTGISRSTIREVLSALLYMNLIYRTKRGTFVCENTNLYNLLPFPEVLKRVHSKDIINFRLVVECEIANLAAKNATDEDIKELQHTIERLEESKDINEDVAFHLILAKLSYNELFFNVLQMLRNQLAKHMESIFIKDVGIRKRAITHHKNILRAIKAGDSKAAKKAMKNHIIDVFKTVEKLAL